MSMHLPYPYVGDRPKGDVAAMKTMASACAKAASEIGEAVGQAKGAIGSMDFHGPAANKLSGAVGAQLGTQEALARSLSRFAKDLTVAAGELADDIKAYERRQKAYNAVKAHNDQVDFDLKQQKAGLGVTTVFPTR